jgi:membrane protein DedA with SNARE-associated domain
LPLPAAPFLIAAGALAGLHQLNLAAALGFAVVASLLSDCTWFYLGKRRGSSIVRLISKICRKPEACAAEIQSHHPRRGTRRILISKFVPGLNTLTPPLAGMFGLPVWKFLGLDSAAALLWVSAYMSLGWVFRDQVEEAGIIFERFTALMAVLAGAVLAVYGVRRWQHRHEQTIEVPSKEALAH